MVDKVKPLKMETSLDGTQDDVNLTETDPKEDYIAAKGVAFENHNERRIDIDESGDITFTDISNPTGRTLKLIQQDIDSKYSSSNPDNYETQEQLDIRDTANRSRSNHTGTQTASTISDISEVVLATFLAGFSIDTDTEVVSTDSILVAIGKLQKQIKDIAAAESQTIKIIVTEEMVTNKQISLGFVPLHPDKVALEFVNGTKQLYGIDFIFIAETAAVAWTGLGLDGFIEQGDVLLLITH
jgi:hypothetical protein